MREQAILLCIGSCEMFHSASPLWQKPDTKIEQPLLASEAERLWESIQLQCRHKPNTYILKLCQFYEIDFCIDSRALISRPDSELLVETTADALEVARMSHQKYSWERRVHLLRGDIRQPLPRWVGIIPSNLPYVKDLELPRLSREIKNFEPIIVLAGSLHGLHKVC